MAARTKSKVTREYKTKYRVRNRAAYEESLRRRGDITVWFDADAVDSNDGPRDAGVGGGSKLNLRERRCVGRFRFVWSRATAP
jgi:hypothetical protein